MKKIFKISVLLMLLPVVTTSCFKMEQEDIFDKSAAERLTESANNFAKILTDQGGVWQMEYFANEDMQGYVYVMKFSDNGSVDISGWNPYIGAVDKGNGSTELAYGKATSQWDVITDNGPVLSFSSYNKYFHVFSRPDDILNTGNGTGNDGRGFEGDYEFTLLKYSGDTLYIEGKKHNLAMLMTRLPADTNDKDYLQTVVNNSDKFFNPLIPRVFLTYPNGDRFVIQEGSGLIMSIYDEKVEDPLTEAFTRNGIIGHEAFSFMKPLENAGFSVQHFLPQEDGSLLCTDDNTSTITAGDLAKDCFCDTLHYMKPKSAVPEEAMQESPKTATRKTTYWVVDQNASSGVIKDAMTEFNSQLSAKKMKLNAVRFNYAGFPLNRYEVLVEIEVKKGTTQTMKFYYEPTFTGPNQLEMKYIEHDGTTGTIAYYESESYSGLRHIIEAAMGTYKLTTPSMLAPTRIEFTSTSNSNNVMVVNVKRW